MTDRPLLKVKHKPLASPMEQTAIAAIIMIVVVRSCCSFLGFIFTSFLCCVEPRPLLLPKNQRRESYKLHCTKQVFPICDAWLELTHTTLHGFTLLALFQIVGVIERCWRGLASKTPSTWKMYTFWRVEIDFFFNNCWILSVFYNKLKFVCLLHNTIRNYIMGSMST